jgi:hypothetical protein
LILTNISVILYNLILSGRCCSLGDILSNHEKFEVLHRNNVISDNRPTLRIHSLIEESVAYPLTNKDFCNLWVIVELDLFEGALNLLCFEL